MKDMKKLLAATFALAAVLSFLAQSHALAYSVNYNNVISDPVFDNVNSMSATQIDTFLNRFPNSCISTNNHFSAPKPIGYNPTDKYTYGSLESAGHVIYDAAQAYNLNPQVIIATLQKEQGLVQGDGGNVTRSSSRPGDCGALAISASLGYNCPDGLKLTTYSGFTMYAYKGTPVTYVYHTCVENAAYVGFSRQVINAAWRLTFDRHRAEGMNAGRGDWYINKPNWDNSDDQYFCYDGPVTQGTFAVCPSGSGAYYDGYDTIDGTAVHMDNGATAALYHYTPHKHGQLLFFNSFTSWFGPTTATYAHMVTARWMQLKVDTYKKVPGTDATIDGSLLAGTQIYFSSKISVDGQLYLRTQHDTALGYNKGIPYSSLEAVPLNYTSMAQQRWLVTKIDSYKQDPITGQNTGSSVPAGTQIYFPTEFEIGGQTYLRTQHDTDRGLQTGIPMANLDETNITYENFSSPRWMQATVDTHSMNLTRGTALGSAISKGTQQYFDHKVILNGITYVSNGLPANGQYSGVPLADLAELSFTSLQFPRYMITDANISKIIPSTGQATGSVIPAGTKIYFTSKIGVNGLAYLRTQHDADLNLNQGILLSDLGENFVNLVGPRYLITESGIYKKNPTTGRDIGSIIPAETKIYFPTKTIVGSLVYLQTQDDNNANNNAAIPLTNLEEAYANMVMPRILQTKMPIYKEDPTMGYKLDSVIPVGTKIYFGSKVTIDGKLYLRTQHDTGLKYNKVIPYAALQ